MRFAFYGRCSTEDAQDPDSSRGWQLRRAGQLIAAVDGEIVKEYFDVGQSRSLPWKRRPRATELLGDLEDPGRGWSDLVIGEPQRAFYGPQFSLTFPLLTHYGVNLWVPEVGGRVDPGSEAHDMVMSLFGGMSKAERMRIQTRVKSSMFALAETTDRHLGGRPPYGYRLADAGPHPNPAKASMGQRLHRLEPDPVTAPTVVEIFEMYVAGYGLRAIAQALTDKGAPSPSEYDPRRNPHRDPRGWAHSAVRAILKNPVYTGVRMWGKQEKFERLIDPNDVAMGYQTRMRWRDRDLWVAPANRTHEPLVDDDLFQAAQARMVAKARPERIRTKAADRIYPFAGRLSCGLCRFRMVAQYLPPKSENGVELIRYRCRLRHGRAVPEDLKGHPRNIYVRQDAIMSSVDRWIATELNDPAWIACAASSDVAEIARMESLREKLAILERKIVNLVAAVEGAEDAPEVLIQQVSARSHERDRLKSEIARLAARQTIAAGEVRELIDYVGGLASALSDATDEEKGDVYQELGLDLTYEPLAHQLRAELVPGVSPSGRVRGGT